MRVVERRKRLLDLLALGAADSAGAARHASSSVTKREGKARGGMTGRLQHEKPTRTRTNGGTAARTTCPTHTDLAKKRGRAATKIAVVKCGRRP